MFRQNNIYYFKGFYKKQASKNLQTLAFLCYDAEDYEEYAKFNYYPYGLFVSCVFLAITLVVYLSLPKVLFFLFQQNTLNTRAHNNLLLFQLLNLHGKTLVCYIMSFLGIY